MIELIGSNGQLTLPVQYNSDVPGLIYQNLDRALAAQIHDQGTPVGKRRFRFFTFSRLLGRYRIDGDLIAFTGSVRLYIGSVHEELLESLVLHLLRRPLVRLGREECEVQNIEVESLPQIARPVRVRTLSPITVYRTLYTVEGKRKTYYFAPFEGEWKELLLENLRRKAEALGWGKRQLAGLNGAHIRPVRVGTRNLHIMKYRETVIKAWTGLYELDLPEPFFFTSLRFRLGLEEQSRVWDGGGDRYYTLAVGWSDAPAC